ncbi:putative protein YIPF1 -like protein [Capsicum annuum]|nr:putative protein YIPF1 -like protein [Capsicum annuum]KAF3645776.1 putative protein YIPF1 -like protein [Capsicum annuum]
MKEPIAILNRQVRKLRRKEITLVKVLWKNQKVEEATWESEDDMHAKYPNLFYSMNNEMKGKFELENLQKDLNQINKTKANNVIIRSWAQKRTEKGLKNHVDLVKAYGIRNLASALVWYLKHVPHTVPRQVCADVARGRGYYVKGAGVRLNQALINFALDFLEERGYTPLKTPFFIRNDIIAKYAQLAQFDEELCLVSLAFRNIEGSPLDSGNLSEESIDYLDPLIVPPNLEGKDVNTKYCISEGKDTQDLTARCLDPIKYGSTQDHKAGLLTVVPIWDDIMSGTQDHIAGYQVPESPNTVSSVESFDSCFLRVTSDRDEKYLISTIEQSLCAYQSKDHIPPSQLPLRYAGYSACFHIEAGSHGHDTLGIFRVHQFEKVVLFCLTSPDKNDSYDMHEEMIKTLEQFFY